VWLMGLYFWTGLELSYYLIQELSIGNLVASHVKDDVYLSLTSCICDMLVKHSILFNGMIRRCHVTYYHVFNCIANEIFEVCRVKLNMELELTCDRVMK
jgi:hypothetical protein